MRHPSPFRIVLIAVVLGAASCGDDATSAKYENDLAAWTAADAVYKQWLRDDDAWAAERDAMLASHPELVRLRDITKRAEALEARERGLSINSSEYRAIDIGYSTLAKEAGIQDAWGAYAFRQRVLDKESELNDAFTLSKPQPIRPKTPGPKPVKPGSSPSSTTTPASSPSSTTSTTESSAEHKLTGTFTVKDDDITDDDKIGPRTAGGVCSGGIISSGYSDLDSNTSVVVRDGDGKILANGHLTFGKWVKDSIWWTCQFGIEVDGIPDADFYAIEVGRRGEQVYSRADLDERNWTLTLNLG